MGDVGNVEDDEDEIDRVYVGNVEDDEDEIDRVCVVDD
jgi:hypothetical protein